MKKTLLIILCLAVALLLTACGGQPEPVPTPVPAPTATPVNAPTPEPEPTAAAEPEATQKPAAEPTEGGSSAAQAEDRPTLKTPILMTSAGQSADVQMFSTIAKKSGVESTARELVEADSLAAGEYQTLVVVVGGSSKGLGAAGIDADQELQRVNAVVEKLKDSCTIVVAHIGGDARRGELSDRFINAVVPAADYLIVVESGNQDGLFTQLAEQHAIPMDTCQNIAQVGELFAQAIAA